MTNTDEIRKIKETLSSPGWSYIDKILKSVLDDHISVVKRENKDTNKLIYSQAVIYIIETIYSELDLVDKKAKAELNLIKKYKKGV